MAALFNFSQSAQDKVTKLTISNKSNSTAASLSIAQLLAYKYTLPAGPVDNIKTYFIQTILREHYRYVDCLNEVSPINLNEVKEYTQMFYAFRYHTAIGSPKLVFHLLGEKECECDFFGIKSVVPMEVIESICTGRRDINELRLIYAELIGNIEQHIQSEGQMAVADDYPVDDLVR